MTDVNETEATEAEKPKGRPRPEATVQLDEKVLEAITNAGDAGVTKETLAEQVDTPANKVYLAIYRLRTTDQIHRVREGRTTLWKAGLKPATAEDAAAPEAPAEV